MPTTAGPPPADLDDADLERELERLHETRHETFLNSSSKELDAHTERMLGLEREYTARFPGRDSR